MKFLKILGIIAIALVLTTAAYAETQSVKVSGDLSVTGIMRGNYDLRGSGPESGTPPLGGPAARSGFYADSDPNVTGIPGLGVPQQRLSNDWFMSTAEIEIDADLTDNVQTVVRLLNQRDWNVRTKAYTNVTPVAGLSADAYYGGAYTDNTNDFDVGVELAYVTLKNFVYCPLTVTIGRQNLWFGKGFIVGANLDNQANQALTAPEFSKDHAFDAVKMVLDYDPWTITGVASKIWENAVGDGDDVNLYGINIGKKFECNKAEAEAYWFFKQDNQNESWAAKNQSNDVHTVGLRGSMDPVECITLGLEGAYQFGQYFGDPNQPCERARSAWALDASAEYRMSNTCWKPKLGAEYILYSGNKDDSLAVGETGTYGGWDPMYRGKFDSHIREWVGRYYFTYDYPARPDFQYPAADASYTNQNQIVLSASLQPVDCVTLKGNYNIFWTYVPISVTANGSRTGVPTIVSPGPGGDGQGHSGLIGQELDLMADWAYTEDVTFSVLGAWFMPSADVYFDNNNAIASDLVASVTVNF
jgi:hypothetical protein